MSKKLKWILCGVLALMLCGALLVVLFYNGVLLFNNPSTQRYPVRGVDVSSYQGDIDWRVLESQGIQFAFIKATEGSSMVDSYYQQNYENAIQTGLRIGAYHFFSSGSPGATQAQNFMAVVEKTDDMLPPVADVELYNDKEQSPEETTRIVRELTDFLLAIEQYYEKKPIIYTTEKNYKYYIAGNFDGHDIWIRNVFCKPSLSDGRSWRFWQYTNRETLEGYVGKEKYIDMNVFNGTQEEFDSYAR